MGNEQSASGDGENGSSGCQQQATTSASVSNGDTNSCAVVVADSWTPAQSIINGSDAGVDGGSSPSAANVAISGAVARSHSTASRTPSQSATARPASVANRSTLSSPFASRSLRIRTHHHPPTRCASAMDNVSAATSHQARASPAANFTTSNAPVSNNTAPTRNARPAVVCRQRSAVTFSASVSGALATGANSSTAMTASTTSASSAGESVPEKTTPLASLLGLSAYQQQQIIQSWPRIQQSGGHTAGAEIFRKLTSKCPPIKETFQKADVVERLAPRARGYDIYKEHGRLLFEVFQTAVNALNDSADEVTDLCRGYGAKHLSLRGEGFQTRMWDDLAELLVEHVTRLDAVRRHREVMRAWTALIMFLVEKMKEGYDFGLRKSSQPALVSPFAHRTFASGASFIEEEQDTRRREVEGADYGGTPSTGRRPAERKVGSIRRDDASQQDIDWETEEIRRRVAEETQLEK